LEAPERWFAGADHA